MSEQTLKIDDLPSMDDFDEGSSLIIKDDSDDSSAGSSKEELKPPEEGETEEEKVAREVEEAAETQRVADEAKKEEKSAAKEKEDEKSEEEKPPEESQTFYEAVTNLTGVELDVDYGDLDPLSPEGVAKRETTLAEAAIASQMDYLEKNYPRAYKVLQHEANGGSFEDLFKPGFKDYSKIELEEENTEQHKIVLKDYYLDKGMSEARAVRMIEGDEDAEGGTFAAATEVLKERVNTQETQEKKVLNDQKETADIQKEQDNTMRGIVGDIATSGKIGNFQIGKAEQKEFTNYALQSIRRDGKGGYSFVLPLDGKSINTVMEQAFFSFKGGDLSKLVEAKAKTKTAQRLKLNLKTSEKKESSTEGAPKKKDSKSLSGFEEYMVEE